MEPRNRPSARLALAVLVSAVATLGACGSSDDQANRSITTVTETSAPEPNSATPGRTVLASYQSATVYAGATDYYFEDPSGEIVDFRVSNLSEEQAVELPNDMLDPGMVEGPPGANPDLVGEDFLLIYDGEDQLVRVELNE